MVDLPRPDVNVTVGKPPVDNTPGLPGATSADDIKADVVISRDNKARSYTATGKPAEVIREVVRQIIDDPKHLEFLPKK